VEPNAAEFELRQLGFQWWARIKRRGVPDEVRVNLGRPGLSYQRVVAVVGDDGAIILDITAADGSKLAMRVIEPSDS